MKYILKRENLNNKYLIILDMDETLINSVSKEDIENFEIDIDNSEYEYKDFGKYITFFRPYLNEFLDYMFDNFNVGVWTAGDKEYAMPILKEIFKNRYSDLEHVLFKHNTDYTVDGKYIKDLDKVQLDNVYIIDDKEESASKQPNSLIHIKPFLWYNKNDIQLELMVDTLQSKFG